jgi:hypothetical protein
MLREVICNTLDYVSDSIHLNLTLVLFIPTPSNGPSRQSHIYLAHARLADSGYTLDVNS